MIVPVISYGECNGCGACAEVYPNIFEMKDDKAWVKDYAACASEDCGLMLTICPVGAITLEEL